MTATAYPATMTADPYLRGGSTHTNFWSNFNGSAHMNNRLGAAAAMDSGFHSSASVSPLPGRPRSGGHDQSYSSGRWQDEPAAYDRHSQSQQHTTYPSLKRPFSQTTDPAAYQELVQDLRDEGSRLTMSQDHKLLSFRRAQDKHTIVDQHGRMQQLELSAQLHGMFFLSEMPSTASDGTSLQPELTCYRRNLFQISGSLVTPRGQLSVIMNESNESVPVTSMEVAVSAIESVDGNPVRLIVIPWKTLPPNAPEISQGPDQEPSTLPLIPFQGDSAEPEGEYAVYPIGWRRLQFRIATANNGRRKELQQHFVLHLTVYGTLADNSKVVLSSTATAPIVVRGRSPRNFQARKEIPLLGSSAGSRGQALVETGLGVVAGPLSVKPQELKRSVDLQQAPRSSFTFGPPKIPGALHLTSMRSNTYPTWNSHSGSTSISQIPSSSPGGYSSASMGADSYPKVPLSSVSSFTTEPQELPLQTSIPSMTLPLGTGDQASSARGSNPYSYVQSAPGNQLHVHPSNPSLSSHDSVLSVPRYVDQGRPTKSSRQAGQQSVHSNGSSSPSEYRYGAPSASSTGASSRDYYPSSGAWTTATSTAGSETSSSLAYAHGDGRSYPFSQEPYKVGSSTPVTTQKMESRSFESMNNYSWSAS